MVYSAIEAHEKLPTIEEFEESNDAKFFLGRQVKCLKDIYPGRVEGFRYKRKRDIQSNQWLVFTVKYYFDTIGEGRAKKVLEIGKEELLNLLIYQQQVEEPDE